LGSLFFLGSFLSQEKDVGSTKDLLLVRRLQFDRNKETKEKVEAQNGKLKKTWRRKSRKSNNKTKLRSLAQEENRKV